MFDNIALLASLRLDPRYYIQYLSRNKRLRWSCERGSQFGDGGFTSETLLSSTTSGNTATNTSGVKKKANRTRPNRRLIYQQIPNVLSLRSVSGPEALAKISCVTPELRCSVDRGLFGRGLVLSPVILAVGPGQPARLARPGVSLEVGGCLNWPQGQGSHVELEPPL